MKAMRAQQQNLKIERKKINKRKEVNSLTASFRMMTTFNKNACIAYKEQLRTRILNFKLRIKV